MMVKMAEHEWYIGVELGNQWTMVSFCRPGMKEPETKGTVAGGQQYRIPTGLCRKQGVGQWYIGEAAAGNAGRQDGIYIDNLLELALDGQSIEAEETYEARALFQVFLRKVLRIVLPGTGMAGVTKCVFTVDQADKRTTGLLLDMAESLGLKREQVLVVDDRESFYAYAVCQEPELWMYDVMLFGIGKEGVFQQTLYHDKKTVPQVSRVTEQYLGPLPEEPGQRDRAFSLMLEKAITGKLVSAVYLIGSGFEGDWMKESLQLACRGRRVFQGKNLYTKGACYAGMLDVRQKDADTVYFCNYKVKQHVFLKVQKGEKEQMYSLAEAGSNLYQTKKECRILLEGEPVLDVWLQNPGSQEAVIESLELQGLEPREKKGCRLELLLYAAEEGQLCLNVKDIGLGEILPGSGREWDYEIG